MMEHTEQEYQELKNRYNDAIDIIDRRGAKLSALRAENEGLRKTNNHLHAELKRVKEARARIDTEGITLDDMRLLEESERRQKDVIDWAITELIRSAKEWERPICTPNSAAAPGSRGDDEAPHR